MGFFYLFRWEFFLVLGAFYDAFFKTALGNPSLGSLVQPFDRFFFPGLPGRVLRKERPDVEIPQPHLSPGGTSFFDGSVHLPNFWVTPLFRIELSL